MRTLYIRWLLPIVAILIVATFLMLSPLMITHAAGVANSSTYTTTSTTSTPQPTTPAMDPMGKSGGR
jgi:hypothetical protein